MKTLPGLPFSSPRYSFGNKVALAPVMRRKGVGVPGRSRFETLVLPHLDAGYNLARWLTRDAQDAEDVVQDACIRALKYLGTLRDESARAWFLTIVRRAFYDWLGRNRPAAVAAAGSAEAEAVADTAPDPETAALRRADLRALDEALAELPLPFREVLVLRELEDLSYKEIARVADIPIGTVMSRLARARSLLQRSPLLQEVRSNPVRGTR